MINGEKMYELKGMIAYVPKAGRAICARVDMRVRENELDDILVTPSLSRHYSKLISQSMARAPLPEELSFVDFSFYPASKNDKADDVRDAGLNAESGSFGSVRWKEADMTDDTKELLKSAMESVKLPKLTSSRSYTDNEIADSGPRYVLSGIAAYATPKGVVFCTDINMDVNRSTLDAVLDCPLNPSNFPQTVPKNLLEGTTPSTLTYVEFSFALRTQERELSNGVNREKLADTESLNFGYVRTKNLSASYEEIELSKSAIKAYRDRLISLRSKSVQTKK